MTSDEKASTQRGRGFHFFVYHMLKSASGEKTDNNEQIILLFDERQALSAGQGNDSLSREVLTVGRDTPHTGAPP